MSTREHIKREADKKAKRIRPAKGTGRKAGYQQYKLLNKRMINKLRKLRKRVKENPNDLAAAQRLKFLSSVH